MTKEAAISVFAKRLRRASVPFLFYTWFDELPGTLRLSATPASKWNDLPFEARLEVCQEPGELIVDFLGGDAVDGIPMSELELIEPGDTEDDDIDFVQRVFCRPLPRLVSKD